MLAEHLHGPGGCHTVDLIVAVGGLKLIDRANTLLRLYVHARDLVDQVGSIGECSVRGENEVGWHRSCWVSETFKSELEGSRCSYVAALIRNCPCERDHAIRRRP
jgi:hypothetical protein